MRIPITMCHGISVEGEKPLELERLRRYCEIARDMDFESVDYDRLAAWRAGTGDMPEHPIMFDFDHPVASIRHQIVDAMKDFGYAGNLFVNTKPITDMYEAGVPETDERRFMTWEELGEVRGAGWHIGAHTHSHPNLSQLSVDDPSGEALREELSTCDELLKTNVGVEPLDFAFTGTSWSRAAEAEVKARYRFGRLWIVGAIYQADGNELRYAELVGVPGEDEADGGPPAAARYITEHSDPYRLPSMEWQALIHDYEAFRAYLEGALA